MALPCSKKISALLRGVASKNNVDFCCLNFLHSLRIKNKFESHKTVYENKDLHRNARMLRIAYVI